MLLAVPFGLLCVLTDLSFFGFQSDLTDMRATLEQG